MEHVVVGGVVHKVQTRSDVDAGAGGNEVEAERAPRRSDTIGARIIGTVKGAVFGTRSRVGTKGGVPCVTSVAIGVSSISSESE